MYSTSVRALKVKTKQNKKQNKRTNKKHISQDQRGASQNDIKHKKGPQWPGLLAYSDCVLPVASVSANGCLGLQLTALPRLQKNHTT